MGKKGKSIGAKEQKSSMLVPREENKTNIYSAATITQKYREILAHQNRVPVDLENVGYALFSTLRNVAS
jgi:hypothetical protein